MTAPTLTAADLRDRVNEAADARLAKAARKLWDVKTYADAFGIWHCQITTSAGWGNFGPHDIDRHWDALRAKARRAILAEIRARQAAPVGPLRLVVAGTASYGDGVMYSITFKEA